MRFNNRFCALMDIPDLPSGAFEHCGDRKIKPQGGVTNTISKGLGTDGSGGGALGALAKIDPGKSIGKGLADVDKFVGREIPGGWKTVGLVAASVAAPYAMSALSSAGAGAAGSAAAADAAFVAADAASLAASGLSEAAIAQNLAMAGVESFAAADAAALAASGLSEAAIAQNLSYAYGAAGDLIPTVAPQLTTEAGKEAFFQTLSRGGNSSEAMTAGLGKESLIAGGGAPVFDNSAYSQLTPSNTTIARGATPADMAALDASQKVAGAEALAKYGGGMSTFEKTMLGTNVARGLLGSQPQPQQNPYSQMVQRQQAPTGAVDYSGLLALLSPKSPRRNPNSLLG